MSPIGFLTILVGLTGAACAVTMVLRSRRVGQLMALARQWQMRFAPEDCFHLAPQVTARLDIPGAADVLVRDLIYAQQHDHFRYYFTVEYTTGVLRKRHRRVAVATLAESRSRTGWEQYSNLQVAPAELSIPERYRWLKQATDESAPQPS